MESKFLETNNLKSFYFAEKISVCYLQKIDDIQETRMRSNTVMKTEKTQHFFLFGKAWVHVTENLYLHHRQRLSLTMLFPQITSSSSCKLYISRETQKQLKFFSDKHLLEL